MIFDNHQTIFVLIFMLINGLLGDQTTKQNMKIDVEAAQSDKREDRALFPRVDYNNEWLPVGRGDPLKDPTYDYMPPVLDRVRYWAEGTSHKNKNDILLLGVASKKLSSNKQKEKYNYGPIKRTYYSPPYQHHYQPQPQHQKQQPHMQQYLPQHLMPPPKHVTDSSSASTNHHQHHGWKTSNNVFTEPRPENSINHVIFSRPNMTPTTTRTPSTKQFLPTLSPLDRSQELASITPTLLTSTQTTGHHIGLTTNVHTISKVERTETAKPLLQTILQTETASPFMKKPSNVYQIEYTSNIYNPEAINSMAMSSSHPTTFTSTKATNPPMPMTTTAKDTMDSVAPFTKTSAVSSMKIEHGKENHYVSPELVAGHSGWPLYNLIIEGHSKVKTYGLKNDDAIENNLPKIRPVQANENPIVERVIEDQGPEFNIKHLQSSRKENDKNFKSTDGGQTSPITSLLSLLDSSFSNFLSDENAHEKDEKKHKTRRSIPDGIEN